jgi:hypothetical protein
MKPAHERGDRLGSPDFRCDNRAEAISPENTLSQIHFQALKLTRLYAVNAAMAETIAPFVFMRAAQ